MVEQIKAQFPRGLEDVLVAAVGPQGTAHLAQGLQGLPFKVAPLARAAAEGAGLHGDGKGRGARTLAHQFQQAEGAHAAHVVAGAVVLHGRAQGLFHFQHVFLVAHLDEVDDHLAADVAQLELAGDGFGGFHVGAVGHGLEIDLAGDLAGVDVHGHEGLGLVKDQAAARRQGDLAGIDLVQLAAQAEALPQGHAHVGMQAHQLLLAGEEQGDGLADAVGHFLVVHPDLADIVGQVVAHGPLGQARLLIDEGRGRDFGGLLADVLPDALEVLEVVLERGLGGAGAHGAHDDAQALAGVDAVHHLAQAGALFIAVHLAGNADLLLTGGQHQEAARQRQPGGEEGALVAGGFLDHLHQHFLAGLEHFLDGREFFALAGLVMGQPVFGVDLVDLEEAVLARAVAHEGSLQVGVDIVDDTLVDIALEFALVEHVQVVFLQTAFLGDGHFHLLAGQHADEHAPLARGHLGLDRGRTHAALLGGFAVLATAAGTGRGVFQTFHITGGRLPQFLVTEIVRQVGRGGRFGALLGILVGGFGTFRLGLTVLAVAPASAATAATALAAGLFLAVFLAAGIGSGRFAALNSRRVPFVLHFQRCNLP